MVGLSSLRARCFSRSAAQNQARAKDKEIKSGCGVFAGKTTKKRVNEEPIRAATVAKGVVGFVRKSIDCEPRRWLLTDAMSSTAGRRVIEGEEMERRAQRAGCAVLRTDSAGMAK